MNEETIHKIIFVLVIVSVAVMGFYIKIDMLTSISNAPPGAYLI